MAKRSEHKCATGCGFSCPREYPFCRFCWQDVPKALRDRVKAELAKRGTDDLDRSALYYAVTEAAASVRRVESGPGTEFWEACWTAAGCPELEVVGR